MKKIIILVGGLLLIGLINYPVNKDKEIKEEVQPIRENETIKGFLINYTIPKDYNKKQIILNPNLLKSINHYKQLGTFQNIYVNIIVNNNSNYNYEYLEDSFSFTDDIAHTFKINMPLNYQINLDFSNWKYTKKKEKEGIAQLIFFRKEKNN